ncbi:MAG: VanW family protein [Clostridia bacterium]|nr:VanW family protein [Clostridia bacterium]
MKKLIAFLLAAVLLIGCLPMQAASAKDVLYRGIITHRFKDSYTKVYTKMDKDSRAIKVLDPGNKINITALYPEWVEVVLNDGKTGYIIRQRIDVTETVDPVNTPPYPIWVQPYYIEIDRTVEVKSDKDAASETLSVLTDGARVAVLGCEDGWVKLIFHRQYGYINSNDIAELLPVSPDAETADTDVPLAVFTSFYNDNESRINNLMVACGYISKTLQPGESMNFNDTVSPFSKENGYMPAPVLVDGELSEGYGGGSCQVSSTLWDTLMQLTGITVTMRKPHGNSGAAYLPHGMDASSGRDDLNLIFRNDYPFPVRIDASCHDHALFVAVYKGE